MSELRSTQDDFRERHVLSTKGNLGASLQARSDYPAAPRVRTLTPLEAVEQLVDGKKPASFLYINKLPLPLKAAADEMARQQFGAGKTFLTLNESQQSQIILELVEAIVSATPPKSKPATRSTPTTRLQSSARPSSGSKPTLKPKPTPKPRSNVANKPAARAQSNTQTPVASRSSSQAFHKLKTRPRKSPASRGAKGSKAKGPRILAFALAPCMGLLLAGVIWNDMSTEAPPTSVADSPSRSNPVDKVETTTQPVESVSQSMGTPMEPAVSPTETARQRTWTDIKNRQIRATLVGYQGGKVALRTEAGRVAEVSLSTLAPSDRSYLWSLAKSNSAIPLFEPRTWKAAKSAKVVEAAAITVNAEEIEMLKRDGKMFSVPSSTFSEDDQDYLQSFDDGS